MIRIVVTDDSAFMRQVLTDLFKAQPDFEVVGTGRNGKQAVELALKLKPDVMTMDVLMPVMSGLEALEVIMKDCPTPVIMFSSLTQEGTDATLKALSLGAVDFISKTGGSISRIDTIADEILAKCRVAARANVRGVRKGSSAPSRPAAPVMKRIALPTRKTTALPVRQTAPLTRSAVRPAAGVHSGREKLVVLGCSTGGPKSLQSVIPYLPKDLPCGLLLVQHMPAGFTRSLAERLDEISQISVKEAENHDIIEKGHVYVAPGGYHMEVHSHGGKREIILTQDPPLGTLRPAADVLFKTAAGFGSDIVSVILTGMGSDGAAGMQQIKQHGGYVIAESEETCVVYGMPKAVVDLGIADEVLPLQKIADAIVNAVKS